MASRLSCDFDLILGRAAQDEGMQDRAHLVFVASAENLVFAHPTPLEAYLPLRCSFVFGLRCHGEVMQAATAAPACLN